jgi:hypothetical protein
MRTTVTLDQDADAIVRKVMRERKLTFKQALNAVIRAGVGDANRSAQPRFQTFRMGAPRIPLDKALQLAGELEDEEIIRKMALGK